MNKIDHIGIAVKNLKNSIEIFQKLGFKFSDIEEVATQKVRISFAKIGESKIEFLEPISEDSPIAKFIKKSGEGMHHIAFEVKNLEEKLEELKSEKINLIDPKPQIGAGGTKVAFIHPKSTNGVLVELRQF
ncbi:MAG: methylmalonyl-CoA epimerase [Candidatus Cloacimonetes bacterium]|nr:methylmalonyl-CoA epimerase [Candidatus Cloacimonadota bacterium]